MAAKSYEGWSEEKILAYRKRCCENTKKRRKKNPEYFRKVRAKYRLKYKDRTLEKQREFKKTCMEYKGGKCIKCGLIDEPCVFDFHHRDPTQKDIGISTMKSWTLSPKVYKELDKCDLLCSNCHRKVHANKKGPAE